MLSMGQIRVIYGQFEMSWPPRIPSTFQLGPKVGTSWVVTGLCYFGTFVDLEWFIWLWLCLLRLVVAIFGNLMGHSTLLDNYALRDFIWVAIVGILMVLFILSINWYLDPFYYFEANLIYSISIAREVTSMLLSYFSYVLLRVMWIRMPTPLSLPPCMYLLAFTFI